MISKAVDFKNHAEVRRAMEACETPEPRQASANWLPEMTRRRIRRLAEHGVRAAEIAATVGCSVSTINNIRRDG